MEKIRSSSIDGVNSSVLLRSIRTKMDDIHKSQTLDINVAEWSSRGAERILDQDALGINTQLDYIIQTGIPGRRAVIQSNSPGQRVVTLGTAAIRRILVLPDPPGTVYLCMMAPKPRISRARKDIAARISASPEVTGCMHTQQACCKVALHNGLEISDVGVLSDQICAIGICGGDAGGVGTKVAT